MVWEQRDADSRWPEIFEGFDQVWAQSRFTAPTFERAFPGRVRVVPNPIDFDEFPPPATPGEAGLAADRFTFLFVFNPNSSMRRKNPLAVVRAFVAAFSPDEPVELLLRASFGRRLQNREGLRELVSAIPSGHNVRLVYDSRSRNETLRLISACSAYVSLHRSEGFGYTMAEAMAYAVPTIASNYSGNLEFMNAANSFLVDTDEVEIHEPEGPFQRGGVWGEPRIDAAAHVMRQVYLEREASRLVAERGRHEVRSLFSVEAVGRIAGDALGVVTKVGVTT